MAIPDDIYSLCPCESGKKFKFCCYRKSSWESSNVADYEWIKLRQTEGLLTEKLFLFAEGKIPNGVMSQVWSEFAIGQSYGLQDAPEFEALFTPWLLFNWVIPEKKKTIAEFYLESSKQVTPHEQRFIETIVQRPYSFYLVEGVEPGVSITLRGLLLPEKYVVKERQASQSVGTGYIVYCRVLPWENHSIMVGCSPYLIPPSYHYEVLDLRDALKIRCEKIKLDVLHQYAPEIRREYFEFVEAIRNPTLPEMRNTDGDPITLAEVRYELKCSPREAFDALSFLDILRSPEEILREATYCDRNELRSITFDWVKTGNKRHSEWDNTVLGRIKIDGARLSIQVNSEKRVKKIQKEIKRRLGNKAAFQITSYDSIEHRMKESRERRPLGLEEQSELMNQPEVQDQIKKMMKAHWEKWFDEPIPALKGLTPRQAAITKAGRERLEALLTEYEIRDQKSGMDNLLRPDIKSLRKELGLGIKPRE